MNSMKLMTSSQIVDGVDVLEALARALFCSSITTEYPIAMDDVRATVLHHLGVDLAGSCKNEVERAKRDDPVKYVQRMTWCRQMILLVFYGEEN